MIWDKCTFARKGSFFLVFSFWLRCTSLTTAERKDRTSCNDLRQFLTLATCKTLARNIVTIDKSKSK